MPSSELLSVTMSMKPLPTPAWPDPPLCSSKVAIVGFATESRFDAPYDDPDCEIWGLNMCESWMLLDPNGPKRLDRLWELHDRATLEQESAEEKRSVDHLAWLRQNTAIPVYMTDRQADIPMSRRMPIERLTAFFGDRCAKFTRIPYYTSTFAFMIATAIVGIVERRRDPREPEDGELVVIAGVEMLNGEEYAYQRSCAEFWCGVVLGYGIPLEIPARSALLESDGMYGYAPPENLELLVRLKAYWQSRKDKAIAAKQEAATRRDQAKADWNTQHGVEQTADHAISHLTYLIRGGKV